MIVTHSADLPLTFEEMPLIWMIFATNFHSNRSRGYKIATHPECLGIQITHIEKIWLAILIALLQQVLFAKWVEKIVWLQHWCVQLLANKRAHWTHLLFGWLYALFIHNCINGLGTKATYLFLHAVSCCARTTVEDKKISIWALHVGTFNRYLTTFFISIIFVEVIKLCRESRATTVLFKTSNHPSMSHFVLAYFLFLATARNCQQFYFYLSVC